MTLWPELEASLTRAAARAAPAPALARSRRRHTRIRLGGATLTAAACAAAFVVTLGSTAGGPTPASAAGLLKAAARTALKQPSLFPKDDQFLYVKIEGEALAGLSTKSGHTVSVLERKITQRWTSATRTGAIQDRILSVRFPSAAAAAEWKANSPIPKPGQTTTIPQSPMHGYAFPSIGLLSRKRLLQLPRNPKAIFTRLFSHTGPTVDKRRYEFNVLLYGLAGSPVPPWLRAECFTDLSLIPGVRATTATDLLGRHGPAIEWRAYGMDQIIVVNPRTSEILGYRIVALDTSSGFKPGQTMTNIAYVTERVTNAGPPSTR